MAYNEGVMAFFLVTNGPTQNKAWKGFKWDPKTGYQTKKEPEWEPDEQGAHADTHPNMGCFFRQEEVQTE
jgi:hypothetical protein